MKLRTGEMPYMLWGKIIVTLVWVFDKRKSDRCHAPALGGDETRIISARVHALKE